VFSVGFGASLCVCFHISVLISLVIHNQYDRILEANISANLVCVQDGIEQYVDISSEDLKDIHTYGSMIYRNKKYFL
jgi:hypothetical protein